jgi:hypothetical protein
LRTRIREEVVLGTGSGTPGTSVANISTDGTGVASYNCALSPVGLTAATVTGAVFSRGANGNVDPPHLRKLYNIASDFRYYRVLSGKLIFVPSVGSTSKGQIVLSSSRDTQDSGLSAQVAFASSPYYKVFPMATIGREVSIPLDVDPSWKKVTSFLTGPMVSPYTGPASTNVLVVVNSVNDLCFSSIGSQVVGGDPNTFVGVLVVEYELELRGVIDVAANA